MLHRGLILKLRPKTVLARRIGKVPLRHAKGIGCFALAPIIQIRRRKGQFVIVGVDRIGPRARLSAAAGAHVVPILRTKGRVIRILILDSRLAASPVAFAHVSVRRRVGAVGLHTRIDVIPRRFDRRKLIRKRLVHSAVIFFPVKNRRMAAIADNHVAMHLLLQLKIIRRWIG